MGISILFLLRKIQAVTSSPSSRVVFQMNTRELATGFYESTLLPACLKSLETKSLLGKIH